MVNVTVNFNSIIQFTDEQFYQLCRNNPDVKFERNAKGEIIILSATVGITGNLNS
jgi:Uma2 family endonuclease